MHSEKVGKSETTEKSGKSRKFPVQTAGPEDASAVS